MLPLSGAQLGVPGSRQDNVNAIPLGNAGGFGAGVGAFDPSHGVEEMVVDDLGLMKKL